jgi:hypothetical protein
MCFATLATHPHDHCALTTRVYYIYHVPSLYSTSLFIPFLSSCARNHKTSDRTSLSHISCSYGSLCPLLGVLKLLFLLVELHHPPVFLCRTSEPAPLHEPLLLTLFLQPPPTSPLLPPFNAPPWLLSLTWSLLITCCHPLPPPTCPHLIHPLNLHPTFSPTKM